MAPTLSPTTVPAWDDPADLSWELERREREAVSLRADVVAYHAFAKSLGRVVNSLTVERGPKGGAA